MYVNHDQTTFDSSLVASLTATPVFFVIDFSLTSSFLPNDIPVPVSNPVTAAITETNLISPPPGITSCLRFPGILDADLRKMQTNLVPFKNAHFLTSSFAPLTSPANREYRKFSILDLVQQMISKDNVCLKCDPLNPGDPREGILRSRYLASFAAFRGNCLSSEVDEVIHMIQKDGSRFDKVAMGIDVGR